MAELTVGYVSGMIAAGVFLARYLFPTLTALILVSFLQEKNTAVTWSVLARTLHSSLWPTILGSDSDQSTSVDRVVKIESWIRLIVAAIISIAGIVTPLGLYDAVVPGAGTTPETFSYIPDSSPMGAGTPPRHSFGFSRQCGLDICPGSNSNITVVDNGEVAIVRDEEWNITIPWNLTHAFASGLREFSPTVSSIWDIEWRNYELTRRKDRNKGALYAVGSYRQAENRILSNRIEIAEGVIMDTKNGGIGFRNHTIPSPSKYGSTWTEDLLFVVPETSCVNMNLTVDFTWQSGPVNVTVTDQGGFVNLQRQQPEHSTLQTQDNFDLQHKAYTGAWLTNAMGMAYLNVTNPSSHGYDHSFEYLNSAVGKSFPVLKEGIGQSSLDTDGIMTSVTWGDFFNIPDAGYNSSVMAGEDTKVRHPNPFNITAENFTNIDSLCQGVSRSDYANLTNVGVVCGTVFGAARRMDGGNSLIREPGSIWRIPIYSCASAAKALIKTVRFRYDGSGSLGGLRVVNMTEKAYQSEHEAPLWGVENTSLPVTIHTLWGIVSKEYQNRSDLSVIRKESLWLPGFGDTSLSNPVDGLSNLPGASFHVDSFAYLYSLASSLTDNVGDYSGKTSRALYSRWRDYSMQADTTSTMINLIWTDIVANAVVGTRGWLSPSGVLVGSANASGEAEVPVTQYRKAIQYRVPFGTPAFVALFLLLLSLVTVIILSFCGKARPNLVRRYLNSTSVGRTMTLLLYPGRTEPQTPTSEWASSVGNETIDVSELGSGATDPVGIESSTTVKSTRSL